MRALVRLLVLALLPVLLFTVSTPGAQAVDKYGDLHRAQIEVESDSLGYRYDNGVCGVAARYAVTKLAGPGTAGYAQQVAFGLDCEGEWNSVFDNDAPSGETIVTFRGTGCELSGVLTEKPSTLEDGVTGKLTEARNFTEPSNGCEVTDVCFDGEYQSNNPGPDTETNVYGCASLTMGAVPLPGGTGASCAQGNPIFASFTDRPHADPSYHQHDSVLTLDGPKKTEWVISPVKQTAAQIAANGGSVFDQITTADGGAWEGGGVTHRWSPTGYTRLQSKPANSTVDTLGYEYVVGVMVWPVNNPGGLNANHYGFNDPANCRFWFGPKVRSTADNDLDEPQAPLGTAVPPAGPGDSDTTPDSPAPTAGCNFSVTDPSSWLEGGMCAVVGLLKGIWDTLGDILGALGNIVTGIVDGILGGLAALFIPSDGFFDAKVQQLRDDVDASSPGKWFGAVSSWAPSGSVGGCAGPTVNVDIMSEHESFQPLNACGGTMATVAALCKAVLSVALVFFGGIACLRGLGAGFGWSPAIGRGGGDA